MKLCRLLSQLIIGGLFLLSIHQKTYAATAASNNKYENVFTRDIYDVSDAAQAKYTAALQPVAVPRAAEGRRDVLPPARAGELAALARTFAQSSGLGSEVEKKILGTLYFQKLLHLEERTISFLVDTRTFLGTLKTQLKAAQEGKAALSGAGGVFSSLRYWAELATTSYTKIAAHVLGSLSGKLAGADLDAVKCTQEVETSINKLEQEIKQLQEGLQREPVCEFEVKYVLAKPRFEEDFQHTIETYLVNSRNPTYPFYYIRKCLEQALRLPAAPKRLERDPLLASFRRDPFFQNYTPATREKLENVLVSVAACSQVTESKGIPLRRCYYGHGEAGIGKSSAFEHLARLAGVPYFKFSIRSASDLTQGNIEGTEAMSTKENPGWLIRPLLTQFEGKTYNNPWLILEDFDRVLLDKASAIASLAFFLDYIDPLKKNFHSFYFNARVNIERMPIFVTANTPLPDSPQYEALRERFSDIIQFDPMIETVRRQILGNELPVLEGFYNLQRGVLVAQHDRLVPLAIRLAEHPNSIRSLKKALNNLTTDFSIDPERIAVREREAGERERKMRHSQVASQYPFLKYIQKPVGGFVVVCFVACIIKLIFFTS